MKYLLLLIPTIAFANYNNDSVIGDCSKEAQRITYKKDAQCELRESASCSNIPKDYNCRYHRLVNSSVVIDLALKATWDSEQNAASQSLHNTRLAVGQGRKALELMQAHYSASYVDANNLAEANQKMSKNHLAMRHMVKLIKNLFKQLGKQYEAE